MTPFEELQAAHKRLSGLRDASTSGPWWVTASRDFRVEIGAGDGGWDVIADGDGECSSLPISEPNADLVLALHRTIDAQLMLLADALEKANMVDRNDGHQMIDKIGLTLARAINGEAS